MIGEKTESDKQVPGNKPNYRELKFWKVGITKAVIAFLILYVPLELFASRYHIGFDSIEGENCLPYSVFLIDMKDKNIKKDDFVAFYSKGMTPFHEDGTITVKIAAGMPGSSVRVENWHIYVDGNDWGELIHLKENGKLWKMGKRYKEYVRNETVPDNHIWVMATHPRSFDSRYWGYITDQQVIGRAIPIY